MTNGDKRNLEALTLQLELHGSLYYSKNCCMTLKYTRLRLRFWSMYLKQRTSENLAMNSKQKLSFHHYKELPFNARLAKVTVRCENHAERKFIVSTDYGNFGN